MAWLLVLVLALLLASQAILASWLPRPCDQLVRIQAVYWFVGYVARSCVLLMIQPEPVRNDSLADERLVTPTYSDGLLPILKIVVVAEAAFLAAIVIFTVVTGIREEDSSRALTDRPDSSRGLAIPVLFGILMISRLAWLAGVRSAYITTLLGLAPVVIGLIFLGDERPNWRRWLLLLLVTELVWSFAFQSKTPIFALIFAFLLRRRTGASRIGFRGVLVALVSVPALLLCFVYIQSVKQSEGVRSDLASVDARYPAELRPYLPVLRRFDLLQAVTDASYASGKWISPTQALERGAVSFIPRPLNPDKEQNAGKTWLLEVRALSVDVIPGNSLAEGTAAEGFAISGYFGAIVEASLLALAVVYFGRTVYSRSLFSSCLAFPIVLSPMLEERGMLGLVDGIGKAWQVAALVVLVSVVVARNRAAPSGDRGIPSGRGRTLVADKSGGKLAE